MGGRPLATSAVAAAAVAARNPDDYSVVAFGTDAIVVKSQSGQKAAEHVVTDLLTLRGFGTTDVVLALRTAAVQLGRSRAGRRITLLLSDCRATAPGDLVAAASGLDELVIIAPAGDSEEAEALARATGASIVMVEGPADVPRAFRSAFAS